MKADYERIQKFYFQDNLCDKATQGYVAAKEGSKPEEEDLGSRKNGFLPRWQFCNKTRERLLTVTCQNWRLITIVVTEQNICIINTDIEKTKVLAVWKGFKPGFKINLLFLGFPP